MTLVANPLSWAEDHVINFSASVLLPTRLAIEAGNNDTWNWIVGDHKLTTSP